MAGAKRLDIAKRQHRERSQPNERRKWGLLEKHKDYVLRARDFHSKQERLRILRERAKSRNPDEFYHGMVKKKRGDNNESSNNLSVQQARLLKTQDANYIKTMRARDDAVVEKIKDSTLTSAIAFSNNNNESSTSSHHTIFVDSVQDAKDFDPATHFNTLPELVDNRSNRLRLPQLDDTTATTTTLSPRQEDRGKHKVANLAKLSNHLTRSHDLLKVHNEMDLQRQLMGKGDKKKIVKPDGAVIYKWKKQRQR